MELSILFLAAFFALNMGAPSFAGSFSTAVGSNALNRTMSGVLFVIFALAGALIFGGAVAQTLGKGIIPPETISVRAAFIILTAATLSLFTANLMHIPQSTSLSTLAAICGVGLFHQSVNWAKIQYLAGTWTVACVMSYVMIYCVARYIYPPRQRNFWVYERIVHHKERLKYLVILTSCYKGFAQGTNNVANAVGPLAAAGLISAPIGLLVMGIIFGLGAFGFSGPLKTSSEKIVPLGLLTATIINVVSGTLTIIASRLGLPFPTVIVYTVSIFAIGNVKDGFESTFGSRVTQKTFFTWLINPCITLSISFLLSVLFLKHGH